MIRRHGGCLGVARLVCDRRAPEGRGVGFTSVRCRAKEEELLGNTPAPCQKSSLPQGPAWHLCSRIHVRGVLVDFGVRGERDSGAFLVCDYTRPDKQYAAAAGNVQVLPNGDVFVGWGSFDCVAVGYLYLTRTGWSSGCLARLFRQPR